MGTITSSGYRQSLYFANETAYGSSATVDQPIGLVQSVNPTESNNLFKIRTMGGTRDFSNIVPGKFEVSGSFDYFLQNASFLRMAIGEDSGSTAGTADSGPRVHTGASYLHVMGSAAAPQESSFPSFTLEFADDEGGDLSNNLIRTYNGCRVNNLSISGSVDEPLSVSADWIGQSVTISTSAATSVTDSTEDPYVFYQGVIYASTGTITAYDTIESASRLCYVNNFDLGINNNLEPNWYVGGTCSSHQTKRGLKSLVPKGREYDASLGLHFADKTQYERFLGAAGATTPQDTITSYNIVLDFVRTGTIGSDPKLATDDWMRIVLEDCKFDTMNIAGSPEDLVSEDIGVFVQSAKFYVVDGDSTYKS